MHRVLILTCLTLCISYSSFSQQKTIDIQHLSVEDGLSSEVVNTIFQDSYGFMWIATANGLNRYDGHGFKHFSVENAGLTTNNISEIHEDGNQKLWLISHEKNLSDSASSEYATRILSIDVFDLRNHEIKSFAKAFVGNEPFSIKDIASIQSTENKEIWVSTKAGKIFQYEKKRFKEVFQSARQTPIEILQIEDQTIWLLGNNAELLQINRTGEILDRMPLGSGTQKTNTRVGETLWLYQPSEKKLLSPKGEKSTWVTFDLNLLNLPDTFYDSAKFGSNSSLNSNDGLIWYFGDDFFLVIDPEKQSISNLKSQMNPYLNQGKDKFNDLFFDPQNRAWISTNEGFIIATFSKGESSAHMGTQKINVPLYITSGEVLNRKTGVILDKTAKIINSGKIWLSPLEGSFELEVALLNFNKSYQNRYFYKIDGIYDDWTRMQGNSVRINELPYGDYILRIKGQEANEQAASNELSIVVTMFRPFFFRRWFLILVIICIIGAVYGIFRWRFRRLNRAKIRLQETVAERTQEILRQKEELERQAKKLNDLDVIKSRFYANISHELRTPLTLILGHIDILTKDYFEQLDEKAKSSLTISKQNSLRLLKLVEEILDLSKLEAKQLELQTRDVKFYGFIHRFSDMFRSFASQKRIDFSKDFKLSQDLTLHLDQNKLEKILSNLLTNAVKYTQNDGKITFKVDELPRKEPLNSDEPSYIRIQVSDTGRGIHSDDLPRIFERFYQSEQPDTVAEGGAGIGLAYAKELTELMDGHLTAQSVLGQGSTFTLLIPKKLAILGPTAHIENKKEQQGLLDSQSYAESHGLNEIDYSAPKPDDYENTPVVLVVEDHEQMRSFVCQVLSPFYQIKEASDGLEALKKLRKHKIDLVVSDVMMPRMDGFQLLTEIKQEGKFGDLPMVMLTARAADDDRLQALTIGVDDYLTKPFNPQELLARTKNLLKNHQKRKKATEKMKNQSEEEFVPLDQLFVQKVKDFVQAELDNPQLSVRSLAEKLVISEIQLARKLKNYTGLTPIKFIRELRLQQARELLEGQKKETIAEVMYAVGFRQAGYFAKNYAARFGKLPSEYFESN